MTFAEKVVSFYSLLEFNGRLPEGIAIMNPFKDNSRIIPVITQFYSKFYCDGNHRNLILGINPGRFGAGVTGIPFTDSKRLNENCGLSIPGLHTYETSSVFVYEMIEAYGGVEKFYSDFYISSVVPLGFTSENSMGGVVNYNYYDSRKLTEAVYDFIVESLHKQLEFGIKRDICFCLGTGKNYKFITELNGNLNLFEKIVPLEHPRYIMQYKAKQKHKYIEKYTREFLKLNPRC
jgi:hypothetical protein